MKKILFYSSVKSKSTFFISQFYNIDITLLNFNHNVILSNRILDFVKFKQYDIAFLYFYKKSLISAFISKLFFKKVIFTGGIDELSDNFNMPLYKKFLFKLLFVLCYLLSDKCNIVSCSDLNNAKNLLKSLKINTSKLSFHPHTINTAKNSISVKSSIYTTISWMGSKENVIRKGVDRSIYVFNEIIKLHPNSKLYIIGEEGAGKKYLEGIVEELGIMQSVKFTGSLSESEKNRLLSISKFYFQLSIYEGFGLAAIEAMFNECIVIHTNVGGLQDTINEKGIIITNFEDYNNIAHYIDDCSKKYSNDILLKNKEYILRNYDNKYRMIFLNKIIC